MENITIQVTKNLYNEKGEKATLSVVDVKTTYDNAKITYQWYEGSEDLLEGENGPNLTVTKKLDTKNIHVRFPMEM